MAGLGLWRLSHNSLRQHSANTAPTPRCSIPPIPPSNRRRSTHPRAKPAPRSADSRLGEKAAAIGDTAPMANSAAHDLGT
jgi:hypothetical protein